MNFAGLILNRLTIAAGLVTLAIATTGVSAPSLYAQTTDSTSDSETDDDSAPRFSCEIVDGEYTVVYSPQSQPDEMYPWATPQTLGGGWSADRRCAEISRRLESYRPDGLLEMRTDVENGYNTVCVTTEADSDCRIVFTVPPGQDPTLTRDRVFENLAVADSGQQTDAVNTYQGSGGNILNQIGQELGISVPSLPGTRRASSEAINLRPFLDPADGGTGTQLQGGGTFQSAPSLNPDRFR